MDKKQVSTSDYLRNVVRKNKGDVILIKDLKKSLHERGFGLLMLIFALPLSIPIPYIPGLTTILALPLVIFSAQMMLGVDSPWVPKWLGKKSIKRSTLSYIIIKTSPFIKRLEKLIKPRIPIVTSDIGTKIIGFITFIFSLSIALPLPLTNLLPAIGVFLMSFGLLSRDGLAIIIGVIIGVIGLCVTIAVFLVGKKIVSGIIQSFVILFDSPVL